MAYEVTKRPLSLMRSNEECLYTVGQLVAGVADQLLYCLAYDQSVDSFAIMDLVGRLDTAVVFIRLMNGASE